MTCREYKDLMMGYLDNELDDEQVRVFQEHLQSCTQCSAELDEFRELKEITDEVSLMEPEDRMWEQYWSGIYNRIERGIGWILLSIGAILLIIFGGFKMIEEIINDPTIGFMLKAGLLIFIAAVAVLFVSVLRERIYLRKKNRYKDVRR